MSRTKIARIRRLIDPSITASPEVDSNIAEIVEIVEKWG
jgi:hypothetical protein